MDTTAKANFHWSCKHTWKRSAKNTAWCLLGCAIGDLGTILFFQLTKIPFPVLGVMILAIINGLITSIILETIIFCLLYTSPSPRDMRRSRMPSSA